MNIQSITTAAASGVVSPRRAAPENATATVERPLARASSETPTITQSAPVNGQQLDQAVKAVSDFVKLSNKSLLFSVDDATGRSVVKVVDAETKEVVTQIPSEEMMAIAKALDSLKGLLVHQKA